MRFKSARLSTAFASMALCFFFFRNIGVVQSNEAKFVPGEL